MTLKCKCGATYKLPDSAAGKRAKCKKCGGAFTVPMPKRQTVPDNVTDDLYALAGGDAIAPPQSEIPDVGPPGDIPEPLRIPTAEAARNKVIPGERPREGKGSIAAYLAAVRTSSFQLLNLGNLVTLGIVIGLLGASFVLWFAGAYGLIGLAMIYAYYAAFLLNVAQDAAGGEDELTQPPLEHGLWDGIFFPALQFGLTYLVTRVPAWAYLATMLAQYDAELIGAAAENPFQTLLDAGLTKELAIYTGLLFAGILLWPMYILIVAVGGSIFGISRFDLVMRTILQTLPAYLVTVGLVYLAQALPIAGAAIQHAALQDNSSFMQSAGIHLSQTALNVVAMVIAMRAIGLYYHHFKRKFAWSWG